MPKLAAASAVAAVCLAAVGCTSDGAREPGGTGTPSTSGSPTASPRPVDLSFAVYGNREEVAAYGELADAYTKNNPHVTITVSRAPDAETAMARLADRFAQGDPPDVFLAEHEDLPALMAEQRVQRVDELLEARQVDFGDGFQRAGLEAFSAEAALQCMPHDVSPLVVYYNTRLLDLRALAEDDEEPPNAVDGWDWEDFVEAAHRTSRGRVKGVYIRPALEQLAPFIWSGGGELADDLTAPTTLTLSDGDSREALEQVLTLARDPRVTPTRAELARVSAVDRFERGRIAMILGTRALTPDLRTAPGLSFDVMPLPRLGPYRTITHMSGYCIAAGTDQLEAAADFLAFAVGREGATITTLAGYLAPSNLEVAHSPAFIQPGKDPQSSFVFSEGVRRAQRVPFVRQWPEVEEQVEPMLDRLLYVPVLDLDALLAQIDIASQAIFRPVEETPSPE